MQAACNKNDLRLSFPRKAYASTKTHHKRKSKRIQVNAAWNKRAASAAQMQLQMHFDLCVTKPRKQLVVSRSGKGSFRNDPNQLKEITWTSQLGVRSRITEKLIRTVISTRCNKATIFQTLVYKSAVLLRCCQVMPPTTPLVQTSWTHPKLLSNAAFTTLPTHETHKSTFVQVIFINW